MSLHETEREIESLKFQVGQRRAENARIPSAKTAQAMAEAAALREELAILDRENRQLRTDAGLGPRNPYLFEDGPYDTRILPAWVWACLALSVAGLLLAYLATSGAKP